MPPRRSRWQRTKPALNSGLGDAELERYVSLSRQVIEQTERRVLKGERVPAAEKIVSIFEPHTDIIVKDRRETYYGHKVCLCVGASNLITDCVITEGNPADTELTLTMLDRQHEIYGRYPLKVALDGGFASKANLAAAKERQIKDVCFAKKRGLEVEADVPQSVGLQPPAALPRRSGIGYLLDQALSGI